MKTVKVKLGEGVTKIHGIPETIEGDSTEVKYTPAISRAIRFGDLVLVEEEAVVETVKEEKKKVTPKKKPPTTKKDKDDDTTTGDE